MPFRSRLSAIASSKATVGLAAAALAVGAASVAAAAATGSSNPSAWGKTVTTAVSDCKDKLGDAHGIGQCVSEIAKQKGAEERAAHSQGKSDQDHPTGGPNSEPSGPPTLHPNAPAGVPVGPPASLPPGSENGHPTGPPVSPPAHR